MARFVTKHNPVLIVDPNAVEPLPFASQFLQAIGGRNSQVIQRVTGIQHVESVPDSFPKLARNLPRGFRVHAVINIMGSLICKRDDHSY